jgi:phospholipid/cholesterol/gamma-HCH transport system ATP-binding protein
VTEPNTPSRREPTDSPAIRFENVSKSFGPLRVLDQLDLVLQGGQTTVIIGPSGCGKTVLLKHIIGLLQPDAGTVYFAGQNITAMPERQLSAIRRRVGFLFQGAALFDSMNVEDNVCFPLAEHNIASPDEQRHRCRQALKRVGLEGIQDRFPENLSGGQKKRVALARAIIMNPEVILYDEPTTGLDPIRSDLINELILRLQKALGATGVVVTHDMASARKVGDRVIMLTDGRIVADTTPDQLATIDNDLVRRFVEGRAGEDELQQIQSASTGPSPATPQKGSAR